MPPKKRNKSAEVELYKGSCWWVHDGDKICTGLEAILVRDTVVSGSLSDAIVQDTSALRKALSDAQLHLISLDDFYQLEDSLTSARRIQFPNGTQCIFFCFSC